MAHSISRTTTHTDRSHRASCPTGNHFFAPHLRFHHVVFGFCCFSAFFSMVPIHPSANHILMFVVFYGFYNLCTYSVHVLVELFFSLVTRCFHPNECLLSLLPSLVCWMPLEWQQNKRCSCTYSFFIHLLYLLVYSYELFLNIHPCHTSYANSQPHCVSRILLFTNVIPEKHTYQCDVNTWCMLFVFKREMSRRIADDGGSEDKLKLRMVDGKGGGGG